MGKNAAKSIETTLKALDSLGAAEGHLVPRNADNSDTLPESSNGSGGDLVPNPLLPGFRAFLDGNLARRKMPHGPGEYDVWDTELAGFGMRIRASGNRYWFVRLRRRGRHCRVSLGKVDVVDAQTARGEARKRLAEVALDGLPRRASSKIAPLFADYFHEFWTDYARHWKASTQARNAAAYKQDLLPRFGKMRLDHIGRSDIVRWRDDCATVCESRFNRAVPVMAAMFKYAEQLGYIRRASNPCRGMPRFKTELKERFLSPQEFRRMARELDADEATYPAQVAIVRLLIFTGARISEIRDLEWDWVKLPRLMLPDSKTGPKTIWLNSQAVRILQAVEQRPDTKFVFSNRSGTRPIKIGSWWHPFRKRCALPDVRVHDLRHSFASVAVREKIPLATIGGLLGHVLPETTARYAHLADETIAEAALRVSSGIAGSLGLSA
ncbi:site-specific integrase [Novosphingobium sp. CCH12-A3]|uniref:site-specific integrase n=1 Tax=Novosphingobium sp. CCH12-A3 TaxID=1768752 RepID=UPI001E318FD3|nr:site-specific integrase [Novosphingobium sp. CCH12-A3]